MTEAERNFAEQAGKLLGETKADAGIYITGINTTFSYGHEEDRPMSTASTMKVFVLGTLLEQWSVGRIDLGRLMFLNDFDRVGGSGVLQYLSAGDCLTVMDLLELMIILSDNTATNLCMDLAGGPENINTHLKKHNIRDAVVHRAILKDGEESDEDLADASARAFVQYLTGIRMGIILKPEAAELFWKILSEQQYHDQFGRYLPLDVFYETEESQCVRQWSKTGFMDGIRTDVGVLALPNGREYAYAVLLGGCEDHGYAPDNAASVLSGKLGRAFYEAMR